MTYEERLNELLEELSFFEDWTEKYEYIISLGRKLPPMEDCFRQENNLIQGCQSRVWLGTTLVDGKMILSADSDSVITKGLIALFIRLLSGLSPEEIVRADLGRIDETGLKEHLAPTRANALNSMTGQIKKAAAEAIHS
ncbi:SufE family protein [Akkermansia glycaniphila]|uniref:Fe-s metabolism associated domain n=1 Tax=Akkermansia glycaniphila TaxID=1679444 RepID=A0A1C7PBA1_9BACT|nr:SufE family protein [Akkermansia glycaniphila]MBT9449919.1 SufE family protein [Akkermansia glycaniphila]OCA02624.1 Fe-S metabolism protein SufE [Akkermansia glycaniphila]SEH78349.1 fe-s metabolism associated domain [Akkermansia glycaniphila]